MQREVDLPRLSSQPSLISRDGCDDDDGMTSGMTIAGGGDVITVCGTDMVDVDAQAMLKSSMDSMVLLVVVLLLVEAVAALIEETRRERVVQRAYTVLCVCFNTRTKHQPTKSTSVSQWQSSNE